MDEAIRLAMIDDHTLVREGLRRLLEMGGTVRIVVDASDAEDAIGRLAANACDVVLLDLSMPGKDGLWCLGQIKERWPELPVLVLSMHAEDEPVAQAVKAGADGYIVKSASREELLRAITEVKAGGFYLHPRVSRVIRELGKAPGLPPETHPQNGLSRREAEILACLSQGLSNRSIAERVVISEVTVKSHLRSIYRKLDVADRTQAVLWAYRHGLAASVASLPAVGRVPELALR